MEKMKNILKEINIVENQYEKEFPSLSIENIKTYMINYDYTLSYMSEGKVSEFTSFEEFLIRHQKAEMMRIYTWASTETYSNEAFQDIGFHRDIKHSGKVKRMKTEQYCQSVYRPLSLEELNEEFYDLEYHFIGNLKKVTIEDFWTDTSADLGENNLQILDIKFEDIKEVYFYDGDRSYIFRTKEKIYKLYAEGGTGWGEGIACYQDTNLETFGDKRFTFYYEEFKEFVPHLEKEQYLNNLNYFLFDQEKRTLVVWRELKDEYKGLKNSLYQLAESQPKLSNVIYNSIFEIALDVEKNLLIKNDSFTIELIQIVEKSYPISYNYAVILIDEIFYTTIWDNY